MPEGYKGLKFVYVFRFGKMTVRLKNAFLGIEEFDLDVLMKEEKLELDIEGVSKLDIFFKRCNVSDEIMTFLGKIYFLNTQTLYEKFGTSMERLMAHGDLQIQSWASSVKGFNLNGAIEVS